jgi:hypothetical protein
MPDLDMASKGNCVKERVTAERTKHLPTLSIMDFEVVIQIISAVEFQTAG